jgi:hypothetical protein
MLALLIAWTLSAGPAAASVPALGPPAEPVAATPAAEPQPAVEELAPAVPKPPEAAPAVEPLPDVDEGGSAVPQPADGAPVAGTEPEAAAAVTQPQPEAEEIEATAVTPEAAPAAVDAAPIERGGEGAWVQQSTRDQVAVDASRKWHLSASLEFYTLAIVDVDPLPSTYNNWRVRGDIDLFPGGRLFLRLGLLQNFSAEEGENGFLLEDAALGVDYGHEVALDFIPIAYFSGRKLSLEHRLALSLPTSRVSMKRDLYAAPYLLSRARYSVIPTLLLGVDGWVRYTFARYAEKAGQYGGMNTQLDFGIQLGGEYTLLDHEKWGAVSVGADLSTSYDKKYSSREEYAAPQSSRTFWSQEYGWDAYVSYTPIKYASVVVGLGQGASVLRDGMQNIIPFHRDETEFFLQILGRY